MALSIINIVASNYRGSKVLYTCPEGKVAKIVFVNRTEKVHPNSPIVNNAASNIARNEGRLTVGGASLLNVATSSSYLYMAVNPFVYESNSSSSRSVGNKVVAFSGGSSFHSRYLNDSELIISGGEKVLVDGHVSVSIKVFEEEL